MEEAAAGGRGDPLLPTGAMAGNRAHLVVSFLRSLTEAGWDGGASWVSVMFAVLKDK